ncbi:MAG: GTP-binding protein, partial [Pedobacter sp.]
EEDVEFADRNKFSLLIATLNERVEQLISSFRMGNVIKNGVSVAIIGKPNAGKSTLLNALLNEERAIVSEIAGTTRDTIEETLLINSVLFRLIDTAGIREHSGDRIENMGIERSKQNAEKANIILHLLDITDPEQHQFDWLDKFALKTIDVYNKYDEQTSKEKLANTDAIYISAKHKHGIDSVKEALYERAIGKEINTESTIVTNARHHEALRKIADSLYDIQQAMDAGASADLVTIDIRRALHFLGEITGQVEVDRDILGTIFGKFCIGK